MKKNKAIVITSINAPTKGIRKIADMCTDWQIIMVADKKTPIEWSCSNVKYFSINEQESFDSEFAKVCPYNHYARKNIGYIKAISEGAEIIAETDDDNIPYETFLKNVNRKMKGRLSQNKGWENVYRHFTNTRIWPRGFPLEQINNSLNLELLLNNEGIYDCPIQQFLADGNPDVDAVYRLTIEKDTQFEKNSVILSDGTYSPFNSQNTIWWPEVFPLLYLPSYVSFRMTDIWRSFIAQVCLYEVGKHLFFGEATVLQERNEHYLLKDFIDEVPGYLNNQKIMDLIQGLTLSDNMKDLGNNLLLCYLKLVEEKIIPEKEIQLLELWLKDIDVYWTDKGNYNG